MLQNWLRDQGENQKKLFLGLPNVWGGGGAERGWGEKRGMETWGHGEGRGNISGQTIRRPTGWRFSHRHCNKFCHQPKLLRDMPPEISFKILQWCKHTNRKPWEILPPLEDDVKMFGCGGI